MAHRKVTLGLEPTLGLEEAADRLLRAVAAESLKFAQELIRILLDEPFVKRARAVERLFLTTRDNGTDRARRTPLAGCAPTVVVVVLVPARCCPRRRR